MCEVCRGEGRQGDCSLLVSAEAQAQPGSLQDVLLHETAVSWLRKRLEQSTPKKCWEETREDYGRRLKRCCDEVNKEYDVDGLCQGYPKRIKLLQQKQGGRLNKYFSCRMVPNRQSSLCCRRDPFLPNRTNLT